MKVVRCSISQLFKKYVPGPADGVMITFWTLTWSTVVQVMGPEA